MTRTADTEPVVRRQPFDWRFTLPLMLGSTLNPVNSSMIAVGLVSIAPTLVFLRWRRAWRADATFRIAPSEVARVRRFIMIELHLIALIPLAAVIMARGLR